MSLSFPWAHLCLKGWKIYFNSPGNQAKLSRAINILDSISWFPSKSLRHLKFYQTNFIWNEPPWMYKLQIEQKVNLLILTNYSFTIYTLIIFQRIQFVNLSLAQSGLFVLTTRLDQIYKQTQAVSYLEGTWGQGGKISFKKVLCDIFSQVIISQVSSHRQHRPDTTISLRVSVCQTIGHNTACVSEEEIN